MNPPPKSTPSLNIIIYCGTALGAGFLAASLQAWKGHEWNFSYKTAVAFLIGAAMMIGYWKILFHPSVTPRQKKLRYAALTLLMLAGIGAFLYPIRFIQKTLHSEVRTGLIFALCALTGVGLLLYCTKYIFDDKPDGK